MEDWRPVVGYEGLYEVSDLGNVRSLDRITAHGHFRRGAPMVAGVYKGGYRRVELSKDAIARKYFVHTLVAKSFIPNPSSLPFVRHKNDDPTNNAATNLAWGNHYDNMADKLGYMDASGRGRACLRGHPLTDENTLPRNGGVTCWSCDRSNGILKYRKNKGGMHLYDWQDLADIYYIALQSGQEFAPNKYSLEDLERWYGHEAKEWRATRSSHSSDLEGAWT